MSEKYDVIIIGAGIGGLTAGAVLSKKGKKVLLLERIQIPGGCSVNFRRKNFEFDASLHLLNGFEKGKPSYKLLEACGIDAKLEFLKPAYLYRSIFPDCDIRVPQCDPDAYLDILKDLFPKEKKNIDALFGLMIRIYNRLWDAGDNKVSPADFTDYVDKTCQEVFDSFGVSQKAGTVIAQLWPFLGLPPPQLSFIVFVSSVCDYIYNGGFYPKGGAQAITSALVDEIEGNRGEIVLGNAVKKILVNDNRVCGVIAKDGREFLSDTVVSNISPRTAFYDLVGEEHLPRAYLEKMKKMEPTISCFLVYLGLKTDPKKFGVTDYTIFLNENYDLVSQYEACLRNDFDLVPLEITFHSLLEGVDEYSQGQTMNIAAMAGFDFWKDFSRGEYVKKKNEIANLLIKRAEKIIPNLSSYIERVEIATPRTIVKFTGSYKGAIYGWSQTVSQAGKRRMRQKTPIEGFYLSGAWTEPSGGIGGVIQSGVMVSNKILNKVF